MREKKQEKHETEEWVKKAVSFAQTFPKDFTTLSEVKRAFDTEMNTQLAAISAERFRPLANPQEIAAAYDQLAESLSADDHADKARIAVQLEPAFVARLRSMPQETHEEKKEVAAWANAQLAQFDLAIRRPEIDRDALGGRGSKRAQSGEPCSLVATGSGTENGSFQLEGPGRVRSHNTAHLSHMQIELMEDSPRQEPIRALLANKNPKRSSGPGR